MFHSWMTYLVLCYLNNTNMNIYVFLKDPQFIPKSSSKRRSQFASLIILVPTIYSASIVDKATGKRKNHWFKCAIKISLELANYCVAFTFLFFLNFYVFWWNATSPLLPFNFKLMGKKTSTQQQISLPSHSLIFLSLSLNSRGHMPSLRPPSTLLFLLHCPVSYYYK